MICTGQLAPANAPSQSRTVAAKLPRFQPSATGQSEPHIQLMPKPFKCSSNPGLPEIKNIADYREMGILFVHIKTPEPSQEVVALLCLEEFELYLIVS